MKILLFKYLLPCQCLPLYYECWTMHVLLILYLWHLVESVTHEKYLIDVKWNLWKYEWLIESWRAILFQFWYDIDTKKYHIQSTITGIILWKLSRLSWACRRKAVKVLQGCDVMKLPQFLDMDLQLKEKWIFQYVANHCVDIRNCQALLHYIGEETETWVSRVSNLILYSCVMEDWE